MIMADGDASRLMQSLVIQSQVAVEADAANETGEIGGLFKVTATVAPGKELSVVEASIAKTIAEVQASGISQEELARVKAKYRTDMLVGLTSPVQRTFVIGMGLAQHNDVHYYQSLFSRYEAVTAEDIQRVAEKYLVADKVVLVVEPVEGDELESGAVLAGPLSDGGKREELEPRSHAPGPDWASMPASTESTPFVAPTFQRRKLSNGLEVWMATWRTLPLVSARLLVRAGSASDPPAQAGLATLTAELWDQGTQELTSTELAQAIDALGTSIGVSAGTNTTQLSFTAESRSFADVIDLVGDMVTVTAVCPRGF